MPLNTGFIEMTCSDRDVVVRIYYDAASAPVGDSQPLVNGPRGFCLDVTNVSGAPRSATIEGLTGNPLTFTIGQGDPVTSGVSRSRTAAQMAALGFTTRGSVGNVQIQC